MSQSKNEAVMSATKKEPTNLLIKLKPGVMKKWTEFRDKRNMKKGPLETQALVEFMERNRG